MCILGITPFHDHWFLLLLHVLLGTFELIVTQQTGISYPSSYEVLLVLNINKTVFRIDTYFYH
jgi:hypothetical protein